MYAFLAVHLKLTQYCYYKSSLNTWKFKVHILLKPSLENFEHYFASMFSSVQLLSHV